MRRLRDRHEAVGTRYTLREKLFSIGDDYWIETDGGERAFKVDGKALRIRDTLVRDVGGGEDMEAKGNVVDHEYKIERAGDKVAEVSKRWFRVRDTYGVEIDPGQDEALIIAITACIDQMTHDVG